jgi:hypothetical protein
MIEIEKQLPEKGKDIIALVQDGTTRYLFRCSCPREDCKAWRCSVSGLNVLVEVKSWKYADEEENN